MTFDWDSSRPTVGVLAKCESVDCSLMSYCYTDATEQVAIAGDSSCRAAPTIRKATSGCESTRDGAEASLHAEVLPSYPFPLSTCLRRDFFNIFLQESSVK